MISSPLASPIASPLAVSVLHPRMEDHFPRDNIKEVLEKMRKRVNTIEKKIRDNTATRNDVVEQVKLLPTMKHVQDDLLAEQKFEPRLVSAERKITRSGVTPRRESNNEDVKKKSDSKVHIPRPLAKRIFRLVSLMPKHQRRLALSIILKKIRMARKMRGLGQSPFGTMFTSLEELKPELEEAGWEFEEDEAVEEEEEEPGWTGKDYGELFGGIGAMLKPLAQAGVGVYKGYQEGKLLKADQEFRQELLQQQMATQQMLSQAQNRIANLAQGAGLTPGVARAAKTMPSKKDQLIKYLPWIAASAGGILLLLLLLRRPTGI